ncbi:hypothetical protein E1287_32155, partial [Actinomadura sp. KC06]
MRGLLAEANWSGRELAEAVNACGSEIAYELRYQRGAVSHWLSGMRPRPPVPGLIAEALSRRLGRPITLADAGFESAPARP